MDHLFYQIALTRTPTVGVTRAKQLIAHCGSAADVFRTKRAVLSQIPGMQSRVLDQIIARTGMSDAEREIRFIERHDIQTFFYLDEGYPRRLKHIPDAPILLYYQGTAELNGLRHIGLVGTRNPSQHGVLHCEALVKELLPYRPLILSGLAHGIDGIAHRKALELGLPTVGVLGHGLGQIYPAAHRRIAKRMLENGGLLSEYPSWVGPEREHFPMRNRIVAGLSDALVVVETAKKGGSVITAEYANTYHKDVFAIPGRPFDPMSIGCNHLIKSHQAALLDSAADIAYVCRWEKRKLQEHQQQMALFAELKPSEKLILDLLADQDHLGIDHLAYTAQLKPGALSAILLELEFKGMIKELPGKRYCLLP